MELLLGLGTNLLDSGSFMNCLKIVADIVSIPIYSVPKDSPSVKGLPYIENRSRHIINS